MRLAWANRLSCGALSVRAQAWLAQWEPSAGGPRDRHFLDQFDAVVPGKELLVLRQAVVVMVGDAIKLVV